MTELLEAPAETTRRGKKKGADAGSRRGGGWSRWRVAARLARRQVRRARASSALVATLVGLPIAGMAGFVVYSASLMPTPEEEVAAELGQMEAWIEPAGVPNAGFWQVPIEPAWTGYATTDDGVMSIPEGEPLEDPTAILPAGTEVLTLTSGSAVVETPDGSTSVPAWAGPAWDPRFAGAYDLVDGARPTTSRQAMVTPAALDRLGIEIGDELQMTGGTSTFTVSGTLDAAALADSDSALFLPESARDLVGGATRWYLPERELTWGDVQTLNEEGGVVALSRSVLLDPPAFENEYFASSAPMDWWSTMWPLVLMLTVAGLFSGYVVVMLAGAAFAVTARRQQRALAIAASVGADRRDLSRTILLQGTSLGVVGGAVGVLSGVGIAALVLALTSDGSATQFWGFHVPWELLVAILVFAVVVGTVSAWMPARRIARTDVLHALRGARRPQQPVASRPVWGSILLLLGVVITMVSAFTVATINATDAFGYDSPMRYIPPYGIVVGPILAQFGILISGRWLLWVCSHGLSRVGTVAKLASRDAAANASRTVPAFAAIAAAVFIGVFALGQSSMQTAQTARNWFYQAPVGSIAVAFWPGPGTTTGVLATDDAEEAAAAAAQLARDAGAGEVAVVSRQPRAWSYASVDEVPDDLTFTLGILPGSYLLDPESGSFQSMGEDPGNPISVIAPDDIDTAIGAELSASDLAAYRAGAAIVPDARFVYGAAITVETYWGVDQYEGRMPDNVFHPHPDSPPYADPLNRERLDAIVVDAPLQPISIAIAPATAERLGMTLVPDRVMASTTEPLSQRQRDRMQSHAEALSTNAYILSPHVEQGPPSDAVWMVPLLTAVSVLVLGASAVALGLARFERRPDDATLAAIGATRSMRRRIGFWQGLIIAGFGTLAGALAGVLPPIGFAIQSGGSLHLGDVPWWLITALAIGLPLAIAAVSWLVPPRHPDLTRRTAIT
ncbi:ABC transporter permease [Microbacterium sp. HD4P20]|uniref:FtsX-like permease family protein n=1 Tax=Microbacterium sp. HD4P20 TaxID=2864874 RepID=UPI001C63CC53|nr:ABC transporter permease [Microbacterium sp. HD4P20]MCP2637479.1 ABC transporter permease [Microbacterium sp. HD4P20]